MSLRQRAQQAMNQGGERSIDYAQAPLAGVGVIGGDVNLTDMGGHNEQWYDLPEWQRTEMMRQAMLRMDKAREDEQKRQAQEDAERLSGMHAAKPREDQEATTGQGPNATPAHYAKLGLYPFQPKERAIDQAPGYEEDF